MQPNNINRGAVADSENMHYLRHMSYSKLYYHIVFVVKNRLNVIDEEHEQSLFVYIMGFCEKKSAKLYRINAAGNHIHMLVALPTTICVADFVRDLKRSTSLMIKSEHLFAGFESWAREYFVKTVSEDTFDTVFNYIKRQKEHHRLVTFEDEYASELDAEYRKRFSLEFFSR